MQQGLAPEEGGTVLELGPVGLVGGRVVGKKERTGVQAKSLPSNAPLPLSRTVIP